MKGQNGILTIPVEEKDQPNFSQTDINDLSQSIIKQITESRTDFLKTEVAAVSTHKEENQDQIKEIPVINVTFVRRIMTNGKIM